MIEDEQIIDENTTVICPWCECTFEVDKEEDELRCKICAREISLEDLDDEKD